MSDTIDPKTFPIEPILRQAVADDPKIAGEAWKFLGPMAARGRVEAGIFLLGLMQVHRDDLSRMAVLVRAVALFPSKVAAESLKAEFHRVPSSPATRTYLYGVLESLTRLRPDLAREALQELANDRALSAKWRSRIEEAAWRLAV